MWNGMPGRALPGAEETPARGAEETTLDHYIERESPRRELVRATLRRAPWWAMSLLVHLVALLVVCRMPAGPALAVDRPWHSDGDGGFHPDPGPVVVAPMPPPLPAPQPRIDIDKLPIPKIGKDDDPMYFTQNEAQAPRPGAGSLPVPFGLPDGQDDLGEGGSAGKRTDETLSFAEPAPNTAVFGVLSDRATRPPGTGDEFTNRPFLPGRPGRPKGDPDGGYIGKVGGPIHPILAGLLWLAKAQDKDGSWNAKQWGGGSLYRVGMTGLAILAYEGMGFTHNRPNQFQKKVSLGLEWLCKSQRPDGSFPWETFYEQGIATMAVCEAYGMTRDSAIGHVAQAAIDYICRIQPEHGGFRYNGAVAREEGDLSVTGWQIMAIKSAIMAGLNVPPQAVARSRTFLASTLRDYGSSSYLAGAKESGSLAVTAIGLACRIFLSEGYNYEGDILQAATYLRDQEIKGIPVRGGTSGQLTTDLYYTYYSTLAMYQLQEEFWASWRTMFRDPLLAAQEQTVADAGGRYILGSWDPVRDRWGSRGGRVYTTSMALLSLEVQYRFIALYRRAER